MVPEGVVPLVQLEQLADDIADRVAQKMRAADPLLSPAQLAERLGISDRTVRELLASGEIPSLKIGGARRVEATAVDAYLESRRAA